MVRRHEEARKTEKNSITDAPASFREELRLMKERIVHLETIVDKIGELEEKDEKRYVDTVYDSTCVSLHLIVCLNPELMRFRVHGTGYKP